MESDAAREARQAPVVMEGRPLRYAVLSTGSTRPSGGQASGATCVSEGILEIRGSRVNMKM